MQGEAKQVKMGLSFRKGIEVKEVREETFVFVISPIIFDLLNYSCISLVRENRVKKIN